MIREKLDLIPLISHRFNINDAQKAYELLGSKKPTLGIILTYKDSNTERDINRIQIPNDRLEES